MSGPGPSDTGVEDGPGPFEGQPIRRLHSDAPGLSGRRTRHSTAAPRPTAEIKQRSPVRAKAFRTHAPWDRRRLAGNPFAPATRPQAA
jgi:hypothetical protein